MERTQHRSAFSAKTRAIDELVNLEATDFHIVPYVTGGLGRLVRLINEDKVPNLQKYGHHTNKGGEFTPQNSCLMGLRYEVKKIIDSKGQSAVLVLAEDLFQRNCLVVIKVLHTQFYKLGAQESHVLWRLAMADPLNYSHTLRILTTFTFDGHYCMVFEPLLPDPLTSIFQEFPRHRVLSNIKKVGLRLLATIGFLHQQNLIHTDLKPDNILLKYEHDLDSVHIVDFGNTINYVHSEVSLYYKDFELQTPLYRAPEVMFGVPFGPEIDIWSLGCIFAELFLGKPLVLGDTRADILKQMYDLLGPFPAKLFRRGMFYKNLKEFTSIEEQVNASAAIFEYLQSKDYMFADLLAGMLRYNPDERLTASQAAQHPFFASHFPVGFLLPAGVSGIHLSVPISKQAYQYSPEIASDIKKGQPSSIDLLRIGTSEQLSELEETTILKPSPRYNMKGENLSMCDEPTQLFPSNIITIGTSLTKKKHKETGFSDMSVVKNVITERKNRFSDNVKEKMSSLLKAINQEQNLVENDMEKRQEKHQQINNADQSGCKTNDTTVSIRPVPTYGAYRGESMAHSKLLSSSLSFREPVRIGRTYEKSNDSSKQEENGRTIVNKETEEFKKANKTNFIDRKERKMLERLCPNYRSPSKPSETCGPSGKKAESSDRKFTTKNNITNSMPIGNREKNSPELRRKTANQMSQRNNEYHVFNTGDNPSSQQFTETTTVNSPNVKIGRNVDNTLGSTHKSSSKTKAYKNNWGKSPASDKGADYDFTVASLDEVSDTKIKKSTAKVTSDLILSAGRTPVTKGSLNSSMEGRKRVHADMSDDDVIDILSPISNPSTRKRQKQMINTLSRKQLDPFKEVRQISGLSLISSPRNRGTVVEREFENECELKLSDDTYDRNSGYCVGDVDEVATFSNQDLTNVEYTQSSPRGTGKKKHFEFMGENWNLQNFNKYQKDSSYKNVNNVKMESKTNSNIERKCSSNLHGNEELNIKLEETDEQSKDILTKNKTKQRLMQFHDKFRHGHQDLRKHVKSKDIRKALGVMPTPIPKLPNTVDNDEFIVDSPEIIYRTFKQQSEDIKQKNITQTEHYNKAHKTFHNRLSDGHMRHESVEENNKGVSKEKVDKKAQIYSKEGPFYRRKSGGSTNTQVEQVYSHLHTDVNHVQLKEHDKYSFQGTPASDVKTKNKLAQRIADRRKKKNARKSLNFQESEEYLGESSEDLDSLEADSTYKEEILNQETEADYPLLLQDRVTLPKHGDGHNTVLLHSHQEYGHRQKFRNTDKEPGVNSPDLYRADTGHRTLTYRHDKKERRSGSNLKQSYTRDNIRRTSSDLSASSAGYGNLKQRDTDRMKKIPKCDATFVMDFESPMRHRQGKP